MPVPAAGVVVVSEAEMTVVVPEGTGIVDITVRDGWGSYSQMYDAFSYALVVTQVTPDMGPIAGGTQVTIEGDDFEPGALVYFAGKWMTQTLTGDLSFTQGLDDVYGIGTSFLSEVKKGSWISLGIDGVWCKVASVTDDSSLTLVDGYPEAGGTGPADLNLARANQFIEFARSGEGENPLVDAQF